MPSDRKTADQSPSVRAVADTTFVALDKTTLVAVAAKTLYETEQCSIIVTENDSTQKIRHPIGIVTERDIILHVVAQNKGPFKVTIGDIMSAPITTVHESESVNTALSIMKNKKINRLPVVNDDGLLIGLLTTQKLIQRVKTTLSEA